MMEARVAAGQGNGGLAREVWKEDVAPAGAIGPQGYGGQAGFLQWATGMRGARNFFLSACF